MMSETSYTRSKSSNKRTRKGKRNNNSNNQMSETQGSMTMRGVRMPNNHIDNDSKYDNDPSWYKQLPSLVNNVANLSFNQMVGLPYPQYRVSDHFVPTGRGYNTQPGACIFRVNPNYGWSESATSPINVAAQQLYSVIRQSNSGRINYDRTDLFMTAIALDNAYMLYEEVGRIFKLLTSYQTTNRYMPEKILRGLGFSPSLVEHLPEVKGLLDMFAYKLASINFPKGFTFMDRHSWLFSNLYKDSDTDRAQLYIFAPGMYYKYEEGVGDVPTHLTPVKHSSLYGTTLITSPSDIATAMNTLLDPLLGSEDISIISGDIAKAFNQGDLIGVTLFESNGITPVYAPEVLDQIHNLRAVYGVTPSDISPVLTDLVAGPYLVNKPLVSKGNGYMSLGQDIYNTIDLRKSEPDEDDVLVSTRLQYTLSEYDDDNWALHAGTEYVDKIVFLHNAVSESTIQPTYSFYEMVQYRVINLSSTSISDVADSFRLAATISKFEMCPKMYLGVNDTDHRLERVADIGELDNILPISDDMLNNINEVAMLSLFKLKEFKYND